jgi:hypothetical protein
MKIFQLLSLSLLAAMIAQPAIASETSDQLIAEYQKSSGQPASPNAGKQLWIKEVNGRSCALCHGENVTQPGKHHKTGKLIKPMAPSVNPARLSDARKVRKWLMRNCKWTFGRECSAQEKADILSWLSTQ